MEIIYLLLPIAILLAGVIVWLFFWAVKSGQFEDLEGPAHRILMDDDRPDADSSELPPRKEGLHRSKETAPISNRRKNNA